MTELGLLLTTSKTSVQFSTPRNLCPLAVLSSITFIVAVEAGASAQPWGETHAKEAMKLPRLLSSSRLSQGLKASKPGELQPLCQHFLAEVESLTLLGFAGAQEREILWPNANGTKKTEHN